MQYTTWPVFFFPTTTTSYKSVMRIRNGDLLLAVILLLVLSLAPRAYTWSTIHTTPRSIVSRRSTSSPHPSVQRQPFPLTSSSPGSYRTLCNLSTKETNLLAFQSTPTRDESVQIPHDAVDSTMEALEHQSSTDVTSRQNQHGRANVSSWLAIVALFVVGQFVGSATGASKAAGSAETSLGKAGFLYSAVSASFLRQNRLVGNGKLRLFNVQNLLLCVLLFQGLQQVHHVFKGLLTVGGVFSTWYMGVLHRFPLITKSVTTAFIGVIGDAAAQFLEERIRAKKESASMEPLRNYDKRRGLAVLGDSILISGPLLHIAYDILENAIPVAGPYASLAAMAHVLIDNFILDAIFVAVMFVSTGIAEGYARQIIPQLRKDYFNTMKAGWATSVMLMPLEFVCFRFLPLNFRVLGMNIIDIFWEAIISYMVHRRRRLAKMKEGEEEAIVGSTATTIKDGAVSAISQTSG